MFNTSLEKLFFRSSVTSFTFFVESEKYLYVLDNNNKLWKYSHRFLESSKKDLDFNQDIYTKYDITNVMVGLNYIYFIDINNNLYECDGIHLDNIILKGRDIIKYFGRFDNYNAFIRTKPYNTTKK